MKKICLTLLAVVCAGILFTGCSKDNVTNQVNQAYSMNSDINPSDWKIDASNNMATFTLNVGNENISSDNFNQEGVLVYIALVNSDGNIGEYTQLPATNDPNLNGYDFYTSHAPGEVYIDSYMSDGSKFVTPAQKYYLKVIFIDAVALSQSSVNTKDYNAVKAAFHLKN